MRPPWVKISQRPARPARRILGIDATTTHWPPNFSAASGDKPRRATAAVLIETLSAPDASSLRMSSTLRTPPPTVSGMKQASRGAPHHVENDVALLVAGGDVEEGELVGARGVIGDRRCDRIAGVAQLEELHAFDDSAVLDVETGNDADFEHASGLRARAR